MYRCSFSKPSWERFSLKIDLMMGQNQRKVIRIDPDNAEFRVVGVVSGHVFQDLQELISIWGWKSRTWAYLQVLKKKKSQITETKRQKTLESEAQTWIFFLSKRNNMYPIHVVFLERETNKTWSDLQYSLCTPSESSWYGTSSRF